MTDLLKTAAEFTKQTGLNAAAIFTPEQIGQIADATQLLGVSAEQARTLGMVMKQTGKSANDIGDAIYDNVDAGISQKVVYDDVLSASDDIVASSGGNVEALGRAASAARKLGMDLAKINQIADGLMNFEDSIGNELEAQLLTGKNINLSKAREMALNNDLEGVAKELAKNGASAAEYASMNRIQQTAMAKAMGMSRAELGKMVLTQEAMSNMTADQIAAARGVTLEQSKQMDVQAKIKKSMDRLAQAFAPILEAIVPIVDAMLYIIRPVAAIVGWLLKWKAVTTPLTVAFGLIAGYMAANKIASFVGIGVKGFTAMTASITKMGGGLKGVGGLAKKAASGIKDSFQGGLGSKVQSKAGDWYGKDSPQGKMITNMKKGGGDKVKDLGADKLKDTTNTPEPKASGEKIKEFLTNLAAGLKEMKGKDVLLGALNLIPASIGLVAMIPGALGAMLIQRINGEQLKESLSGIASGVKEFASAKVMLGALGLIATSAAFVLMIPGAAGMALMSITAPMAAAGIYALIPALTALGTAMASGVGALGLLALVGLAVGMGAAFALIGAGAMMMGKGIQYAARGISTIVGQLSGLITLLPSLFLLGPALMSIAAGLGMIAVAGMAAIPALMALSAFAIVVTPLATVVGSMFGDGGGEGEGGDNSMAEISAKLDKLISVVSKGGDVFLDGNKVGDALVLGSYKSS